jgi:ribosomal subunit interface protein
MSKRITFRHIEHTPVLDQFANKQLEKVEKLLTGEHTPVFIEFVIVGAPNHAHHEVDLRVKTPHFELVAKHEGPDMYQEIERVTHTMAQEIIKAKEKYLEKQRNKDSYKSA